MDPRRPPMSLACPPHAAGGGAAFPGRGPYREPRVDDRLAPPETRLEYLGGVEVFAAPADPPHAEHQSLIDRVIGAHAARGYAVAVEMLTRTSEVSDFAPDVSVYFKEPDPETGGRRLEELAFEVTSEQALSVPTTKARELIRRGVRRVFCMLVKQRRLLEWSRETDGWAPLPDDAVLSDPCLVRPLRVSELLDAAAADNTIALALLVKRPPAIAQALHEERLAEAREAVLDVLVARGFDVSESVRVEVSRCTDLAQLKHWHRRAIHATSVAEAIGLSEKDRRS
ncbi:Uma2 family endonuclease [Sorangium sp. So ce128]|uniref:Uma2 family endonuclease n=1 Tax=Sorangium sp. So ce128 TaxID=3133281 RepID=UPI003F6102D6